MTTMGKLIECIENHAGTQSSILLLGKDKVNVSIKDRDPNGPIIGTEIELSNGYIINLPDLVKNGWDTVCEYIRRQIKHSEAWDSILLLKSVHWTGLKPDRFGAITIPIISAYSINKTNVSIVYGINTEAEAFYLKNGILTRTDPDPWTTEFDSIHDYHQNPNNKHLHDKINFMKPDKTYNGKNILIHYSVGAHWYINIGMFWMPTTVTWIKSHLHLLSQEILDEIEVLKSFNEPGL
ncbi:hypothetical protein D3C78_20380 [compost metagenome]